MELLLEGADSASSFLVIHIYALLLSPQLFVFETLLLLYGG
jgi:hypothetical protein